MKIRALFLALLLSFSILGQFTQYSYATKEKYTPPYTQSGYAEVIISGATQEQIKNELSSLLSTQNIFLVKEGPQLIFESEKTDMGMLLDLAVSMTKSSLTQEFGNNLKLVRIQFQLVPINSKIIRVIAKIGTVANPETNIEQVFDRSRSPEEMQSLFKLLGEMKNNIAAELPTPSNPSLVTTTPSDKVKAK